MNSVEKDNIIQKAICCSGNLAKKVANMYLTGSPCADKEFQKLFLLVSYTETLGCYRAPLEISEYELTDEGVLTETITTTEYINCLTEIQADSIATQISRLCDLCDEH